MQKKKKTLQKGDSLEENDLSSGGSSLKPKTPNMRRAASPMLGRKTPMLDRKKTANAKTPALLKYVYIHLFVQLWKYFYNSYYRVNNLIYITNISGRKSSLHYPLGAVILSLMMTFHSWVVE